MSIIEDGFCTSCQSSVLVEEDGSSSARRKGGWSFRHLICSVHAEHARIKNCKFLSKCLWNRLVPLVELVLQFFVSFRLNYF